MTFRIAAAIFEGAVEIPMLTYEMQQFGWVPVLYICSDGEALLTFDQFFPKAVLLLYELKKRVQKLLGGRIKISPVCFFRLEHGGAIRLTPSANFKLSLGRGGLLSEVPVEIVPADWSEIAEVRTSAADQPCASEQEL